MSTRSHVVIVKKGYETCYVYHHYDGYPEGVGKELKDILTEDEAINPLTVYNYLNKYDSQYEKDTGIHGDEEYLYKVDCDNMTLTCYDVYKNGCDDASDDSMVDENIVFIHSFKFLAPALRQLLNEGEVKFSYKKVNGEIRVARGTLNTSLSEDLANYVASGNRTTPDNVITYWDLDKNAWRTLKEENLIEIFN